MDRLETFTLCEYKSDRLWVNVWAEIKDGRLEISGQDLGDAPKQYFGMGEFEYWYKFDETSTGRLIALLPGEDRDVEKLLYNNFSGLDGCNKLKDFCNVNGIKYEYGSWHTD
jgi:hypothetical protein